jgi:nitrate/TMAO reductase-like tetraheme cytochrome c subunit
MPGPAARAHDDAQAMNARCAGCHGEIARELAQSMHAGSYRDPSFQTALQREPLPFCRGCHAPEAPKETLPPAWAATMGVSCVTCHVTGSAEHAANPAVLAAPAPASAAAPAPARGAAPPPPHAIVRDARFASEAACGSCHEFDFPDGRPEMQLTLHEHALSANATTRCSGCHMPLETGEDGTRHRSHAFVTRSPARLGSAAAIEADRPTPRTARVTLTPRGVGHAFPTGDLFRRLTVEVATIDEDGHVLHRETRFLSRHFEPRRANANANDTTLVRTPVGDDRVGAHGSSPSVVEFDMGHAAEGRTIAWTVRYQRIQNFQSYDERKAVVTESTTLASGELPPVVAGARGGS